MSAPAPATRPFCRLPKTQAREKVMLYKTIALELLQDRPQLYEELRSTKRLLPTLETYAIELKDLHQQWKARLRQARPNIDPTRLANEALELATEQFQARLPSESQTDEANPLSLDAMMSYLRATPPA
jgi:hypothetical protein